MRSVLDPFLERLDCPDPSLLTPKRNLTLTAIQALALMNNPFVVRMSEHLAGRLSSAPALDGRIRLATRLLYGRDPGAQELELFTKYAGEHGLANLGRLLFNTNEFLFAD